MLKQKALLAAGLGTGAGSCMERRPVEPVGEDLSTELQTASTQLTVLGLWGCKGACQAGTAPGWLRPDPVPSSKKQGSCKARGLDATTTGLKGRTRITREASGSTPRCSQRFGPSYSDLLEPKHCVHHTSTQEDSPIALQVPDMRSRGKTRSLLCHGFVSMPPFA